jgi:two-component system sensor histidine kinase KdpD
VRDSGHIDLHVVRPEMAETHKTAPRGRRSALEYSPPRQYLAALATVGGCTVVNATLQAALKVDPHALALIYLLGVVVQACFVGRGPTLFTAAASALLWDFFFTIPQYSLKMSELSVVMMVGMYFVVAIVMGQLVTRLRWQERAERRREERSTALYLLTRDLADAADVDDMARRLVRQVAQAFKCDVAMLLRDASGGLSRTAHPASMFAISEKEQGVAAWAFRFGKAAGRFTDNLPLAEAVYIPLATNRGTAGVIAVKLSGEQPPTLEQRDLLDAFARQTALVLDRFRLDAEAEQARLLAESEKLSKALLNSISHELRTPISAITAAASTLAEFTPGEQPALQKSLAGEIQESAARLNRLVGNLLDMTRLESGKVKPRLEWCDVADLVNVALRRNATELAGRHVQVEIPKGLPLVRMDFVLIEQALNNLLLNAATYTAAGTPVEITAAGGAGEVSLSVADRGPGLPPESLPHVFDKFYRVPGAPPGGTGLGLSIVKGFVEAHGGRVEARNREGGGAQFTIYLPVQSSPEPSLEAVA